MRTRERIIVVAIAVMVTLAGLTTLALTVDGAPAAQELPSDKVFVCKYVITPGEGERLQTGQNPISVSVNAIPVQPVFIGLEFADQQGRSVVIAFDVGQPEPSPDECPPPNTGTTVPTTAPPTTGPPTTPPTPGLFSFTVVVGVCPPSGVAAIAITFPARPDLDGQTGTLSFSTGGSQPLTFQSGATVTVPYPPGTTADVTLTYVLGAESATATVSFPADCLVQPTTTPTTGPTPTTTPGGTTTPPGGTTTTPGATTTLPPGGTTTTPPGGTTTTGAGTTTTQAGTTTTRPFSTLTTSVCVIEVATGPGC